MFVLFLNWDLKYTGLVTNFGPVPFVPWGTSRRFGRSKNIHNEKASTAQDSALAVGEKKGTITRQLSDNIVIQNWKLILKLKQAFSLSGAAKYYRIQSQELYFIFTYIFIRYQCPETYCKVDMIQSVMADLVAVLPRIDADVALVE